MVRSSELLSIFLTNLYNNNGDFVENFVCIPLIKSKHTVVFLTSKSKVIETRYKFLTFISLFIAFFEIVKMR